MIYSLPGELSESEETNKTYSFAFRPDGKVLAVGNSNKQTVRLLDVITGGELSKFENVIATVLRYSKDGNRIAAVCDESIAILDLRAGGRVAQTLRNFTRSKSSIAISLDGRFLAEGSEDNQITVLDLRLARPVHRFVGSWLKGDVGATAVAFSPDGALVASGVFGITTDIKLTNRLRIWELATGRVSKTLGDFGNAVISISFSNDGRLLAAGDYSGGMKIWETGTWKVLESYEGERLPSQTYIAFSPNVRWFAAIRTKSIIIYDVANRKWVRTMEAHSPQALVFSPDSKRLAWADYSTRKISIREVESGRPLLSFPIALKKVNSLAFSPNGRWLAGPGPDHTVLLWDAGNGKEVCRLIGHAGYVNAVAFSPDGHWLISASADGSLRVWAMDGLVDVSVERTKKEFLRIVNFIDSTWVVAAPDGRFDSNNLEEIKGLNWVMPDDPMKPLSPVIFMRDYYAPRLLKKLLSGGEFKPIRPLAELNRTQPKAEVVGIDQDQKTDGLVTVRVRVKSQTSQTQKNNGRLLESGAYDLRLFRDGQLVGTWPIRNRVLENSETPSQTEIEEWRVQYRILETGEEIITFPNIHLPQRKGVDKAVFTAYAFNSDRVKSETSKSFPYKVTPRSQHYMRRAYLITMAVNANQSGWDLSLAVPSAKLAAELWTKKLAQEYKIIPVTLKSEQDDNGVILPNATATKVHLQAVLDILAGREKNVSSEIRKVIDPEGKLRAATPDDAIVIYIASHGYADPQGRFYVIPFDTGIQRGVNEKLLTQCQQKQDISKSCTAAKEFLNRSISSNDLSFWWQGVDAGEMVMVLDSCHSAAVPGQGFRPGPLGDRGFGQLSYDKGMRILSATQPDKTARATSLKGLGHTLLMEALKTAYQDQSDMSIEKWLRATERQLPQNARHIYPELKEDDIQFPELMDFRFVKQGLSH